MPLMLLDDDRTPAPGGPRFRLIVLPPACVERRIERLIERLLRWIGGARG